MVMRLIVLVLCCSCHLELQAQPFSELVVFGDSDSDVGNWTGRFSDGMIWVDELALQLNVPFTQASKRGGLNFAMGGARTGSGIDTLFDSAVPQLGAQIAEFLKANRPRGDQLFTISVGYNDFGWGGERNTQVPIDHLEVHFNALIDAGVQNIVVGNLQPMDHSPSYRGNRLLKQLVPEFNNELDALLHNLVVSRNLNIWTLDVFGLINEIIASPTDYGIVNLTSPAQSVPRANPDEFMYWDESHYTTAIHRFIGQRAAAILPDYSKDKFVSVIETGDEWKYFSGTDEPSEFPNLAWTTRNFDDSGWKTGSEGFAYGRGKALDNAQTVLADMRGNYPSIYVRHAFATDNPESLKSLKLHVDYDDAFIAYINGVEVARSNVGTTNEPMPFDATASVSHASGFRELVEIDLSAYPGLLDNENILAIQGLNRRLTDSDFVLAQLRLDLILVHGDFNGNAMLDVADIDALTVRVRSGNHPSEFDLDGNDLVNANDRALWVHAIKKTYFGDANLDGAFGSDDLVTVFQTGEFEDEFEGNSTWADGDWNGDGDFGTDDLVLAFQDGGFERESLAADGSVPEPKGQILIIVGIVALICRSRISSNSRLG